MLRKLVAAIICAGVMAPSTVFGLGMGQVKLDSFLNQPLEAKIELLQTRGLSSAEIIAGMASSKEFAAAGVDRSFFLSQLKFEVQEVDGKLFVVVTSKKPVTEPYLNFLVEVQWPAGRLLREYTLLLDPPEFADALPLAIRAPETQPATEVTAAASERASTGVVPREKESQQLAETAMSAQAETQPESDAEVTELVVPELDMSTAEATADPVSSERQAPSTVQQANKAVSDVVVPGSTIQSYTVRSGDTLNGIVSKTLGGDPSISNQQALIAFQYLNPDAFIDDNVNLVKKGAVLRVPSEAEVRQISREEAIQEIAAHNKAWRARVLAVQNRKNEALAGRQLDGTGRELAPNATPDEGDQGRLSLVAPGVEEDGASARGEAGEGALADYRDQLAVAREMTEQVKVSNEGLVAELNELTALVEKTDSLLALKNEQIAALKSELEAIREAQGEMAADINQDVAVIDEESTDMVDEQPSVDLESEAQDEMVEDTASEGAESEEASAEELTFTEVDADSAVEETVLEETPVDVPSQDFDESISQAPSVSSIFTNPLYLGIGGSALIALLLLLWLRSRNSDDEDEEFEEELDDDEEEDHSFDADLRGITEEGLDRDLLKSDDEFDLEAALS